MIVRTARRASCAQGVERTVVATDDRRIAHACAAYGVSFVMTSADHATGTDRVAEAAGKLKADLVVNVQGDEPLVAPSVIDSLLNALAEDAEAVAANAACPLSHDDIENPNVVKAVANQHGHLMFLSRRGIPFAWDTPIERKRHLGIYAFRAKALATYRTRPQGALERAERVEMYRFLEWGDRIVLIEVPHAPPAVDVPEDVARVEAYAARLGGWLQLATPTG